MYFLIPWLYMTNSFRLLAGKDLFEIGYPPHTYIIEKRIDCINKLCYCYPKILKNEIEYLSSKLAEQSLV